MFGLNVRIMNRDSQSSCGESPNDPKLSDGGGLAQPVPNGGTNESRPESNAAPLAEAQAVTARSRSLQRIVRRCGYSDTTVEVERAVSALSRKGLSIPDSCPVSQVCRELSRRGLSLESLSREESSRRVRHKKLGRRMTRTPTSLRVQVERFSRTGLVCRTLDCSSEVSYGF